MYPIFHEKGTVIKVNGSDNLNASPVNNPPLANGDNVGETSPPSKQSDPEPQKNEKGKIKHKLSRFVKKVFKKKQPQPPYSININFNITIEDSKIVETHNFITDKKDEYHLPY